MSIEDRLADLLVTRFGVTSEDLDPDVTFGELEIDSISLVELAVISSDEFGIAMRDDDFTPDHTLHTAADLIELKGARA